MNTKQSSETKGFDFSKKHKVSVWVSQNPYETIPDEYFEENFNHKETRATNQWSDNFKMNYFNPENMETNGAQEGTVSIKQAAGQCSFSSSYIDVLMSKSRKKNLEDVSWIVLLFEYEYSMKTTGIEKDEYLTFLGAFDYDEEAENVYEVE